MARKLTYEVAKLLGGLRSDVLGILGMLEHQVASTQAHDDPNLDAAATLALPHLLLCHC